MLELESRDSCIAGKYSTMELCPEHFNKVFKNTLLFLLENYVRQTEIFSFYRLGQQDYL